MSCWVVPSIAAELWGVSLEHVMSGVESGHIPAKQESGFFFVDVAPHSPTVEKPRVLREPTPPTYAIVSSEEMEALAIPLDDPANEPQPALFVAADDEDADDADATHNLGSYRSAREAARHNRRPPALAA